MATAPGMAELMARLRARLTPPQEAALATCQGICAARGLRLFLVGGAVRDLLLDRPTVDLDLAVEGDAAAVARELAALTAGRAVVHPRFGTASVRGEGFLLDIAQTRRETYARPGALPSVQPADITADLARRDLTINAMALRLAPEGGELLDPHGGLADLRAGLVRVLHDASFQDDATRMLRAVRYALRLNFRLAADTEARVRRDLGYLQTISGARLRRELTLLLAEQRAPEGALIASRLGVLGAIHAALTLDEAKAEGWRRALAGHHFAPLDELGFCFLADPRDDGTIDSLSARLHLTGRLEHALRGLVRLRADSAKLTAALASPAAVVELLDGRPTAAVWAFAFLEEAVQAACLAYLSEWRRLRPHLTGEDLLALGVPAGVSLGETLRRLRRARLEGRARSRQDEIELVRRGMV